MSYEDINNGDADIYGIIGVTSDASEAQIRRLYRQKALECHPDKDNSPQAAVKFQLLSRAYEIISNPKLRVEYNKIYLAKKSRQNLLNKLNREANRFKQELDRLETQHNSSDIFSQAVADETKLELLREEGFRLRRAQEKKQRNSLSTAEQAEALQLSVYRSYKDIGLHVDDNVRLKFDEIIDQADSNSNEYTGTLCTFKWKYKPEIEDKLTEETLAEIMSIFGPVSKLVKHTKLTQDHYCSGTVQFEDEISAEEAASYDYKSSKKWDKTRVRKLASLLRGCTRTLSTCETNEYSQKLSGEDSNIIEEIMVGNGKLEEQLRSILGNQA